MPFETDIFTGCEGLFFCLGQWSNTVTEGYFWSIILIAFGIVMFMGTFNFGAKRAFGYSSLASSFLGLTLIQLGFIPLWFFTLVLIASGVGIAIMLVGRG